MKSEHKLAIHELLNRAAYYFDLHDTAGLEACFREDAKMLVDIDGGDTFGPFEGSRLDHGVDARYSGGAERQAPPHHL